MSSISTLYTSLTSDNKPSSQALLSRLLEQYTTSF